MEENYEINSETLRCDLEELLDWLKDEVMNAPRSTITEQGKKGSSEFSQCVDAYDKLFKLYQAELARDVDTEIKFAEKERKTGEYLEDIARKTEDFKLREKELELKEKDILDNAKNRSREMDVKERDMYVRELSTKENARWWNKPIVTTGAICLTTLIVNGTALYLNASEAPLKNIFEKWMIRPKL